MKKTSPDTPRLSPKEEAYAAARAAGASQMDAYRASHPKSRAKDATARTEGARFDRRPRVHMRIAQLVEEIKQRTDAAIVERVTAPAVQAATEIALTQQWVRAQLVENVRIAKQAVPVLNAKGEPTGEYRVDLAAANKALELLGKDIGMFRAVEEAKPSPLDALDDEQVRALARMVDIELGRRVEEDTEKKPH